MSSILPALQLPAIREQALEETGGSLSARRQRVRFRGEPGLDGGPIKTHTLLDEGDPLTVARVLVD